ncbi:MAG: hypothetical protein ACLGIT_10430 [Gammaproteobacteria bacterium]
MRTLIHALAGTLLALLLAAALAWGLAVDDAPSVPARDDVTAADVDRAVALARRHDPRRALPGQQRRVLLGERDVDLLVAQAAQRALGAHTRVRLHAGRLELRASLALPAGRWLNAEVVLRQGDGLPQVERLRVGRLPLPPALALPLLRRVATQRGLPADALQVVEWIDQVTLTPGQVAVVYRIDRNSVRRLRAALVAPADRERLQAHHSHLSARVRDFPGRTLPLATLMRAQFVLAAERSRAGADDTAAAENRAALLALALYANHRSPVLLVPEASAWPAARPLGVTLRGRRDLALHFLVSALIAAEAGTPLADAVGLWKELDDTRRGGSGFSFADLAADRAGTRLGEAAVREARRLQAVLADADEPDFMPDVAALPEFLSAREFVARYGGVGAPAYERQTAEIESRIDALPLWR